jgi:transposase
MRRYTVGAAGLAVNQFSSESGGSTPSRRTNLKFVLRNRVVATREFHKLKPVRSIPLSATIMGD